MLSTARPRLFIEKIEGVIIVTLADAEILSEVEIAAVEEELRELLTWVDNSRVLLNFRDVRLMSSSMIAVLVTFARRLASKQGQLKLCSLSQAPREAFRVTRLDRRFEIHDDEGDALAAFAKS
jgi:anti-sigma B factor antagonist